MKIQAVVWRKIKARKGKGFSRAELKEIGLSIRQALKLRIPIDTRRRTKREENIEALKRCLSQAANQKGLRGDYA